MKKLLKIINNYIGGLNGVILILYTTFIFSTHSFVSLYYEFDGLMLWAYFLRKVIIILTASVIICPLIIKFVAEKISINVADTSKSLKNAKLAELGIYFLPLFRMIINYIGFFPGGYYKDSFNQLTQAVTNSYSDWHPVLHTLLAFKLPLLISDGWIGSVVLIQAVSFCVVISYSLKVIKRYTNYMFTYIVLAFYLLNPNLWNIAIIVLKDTAFLICVVLLLTYTMNIYFTKGEWVKKPLNLFAFIIVDSVGTMVRHNALLFTVPLTIAVLLFIDKKRSICAVLSVIIIVLGIKYPVYSLLNVPAPENRQVEMLGLPLTVIGAVAANEPNSLDKETKSFIYSIADEKVWVENYSYGDFNSVKFDKNTNLDIIEKYGVKKVISMMTRCFINSPSVSITALIKLTNSVYSISDNFNYNISVWIADNNFNIAKRSNFFTKMINKYTDLSTLMFPHIFMYSGSMNLLLIIVLLSKVKLNNWKTIKKSLLALPVLTYNFGTMLLLTGGYDSSRFFAYTCLAVPILLAILLSDYQKDKEQKL